MAKNKGESCTYAIESYDLSRHIDDCLDILTVFPEYIQPREVKMTVFETKIYEALTIYDNLLDSYKTRLEHCPEGSLLYQKKRGCIQFLHAFNKDGKRIRQGINTDPQMIRDLAKKEFDSRAYELLSHDIAVIKEALNKMISFDPDQILKSMTKAYALLPEEYFFDRDKLVIAAGLDGETLARIKRHEEWWRMPYKEYWGYPENKVKTTSRGQKVRSLSELLIAEALYKYSIPFHYEQELKIDGKMYAPDFTFEGWDRNLFYLDYFGMMSNPKYAKKNILKLDDYYDIGLIPGDNLITVFDSKGIVNMEMIEAIIKNEIIPRL